LFFLSLRDTLKSFFAVRGAWYLEQKAGTVTLIKVKFLKNGNLMVDRLMNCITQVIDVTGGVYEEGKEIIGVRTGSTFRGEFKRLFC
jgi:hypothetical protein